MFRLRLWLGLFLFIIAGSTSVAMASGDVLITGAADISIWLNKDLIGKTGSGTGELFLADLDTGTHTFRATKSGYVETIFLVDVEDNRTVRVQLSLASPSMQAESLVETLKVELFKDSADMVLRSVPLGATVFLNDKKVGLTDLKLSHLKPDTYAIRFVQDGKTLKASVKLHTNEESLLKADFNSGKIIEAEENADASYGAAVMLLQTARASKPALFPHRKHQDMFDCGECHHGRNDKYEQLPYVEGMHIQKCVACHNSNMPNKKLNHFKLAAHARCKGCHRKEAAVKGKAGPIIRCTGCHPKRKEK